MFYTKNTQGDFGTYRCISKNSIGQAEEVVELYGQFPDHQYGGDWIEAEEILAPADFSSQSFHISSSRDAQQDPNLLCVPKQQPGHRLRAGLRDPGPRTAAYKVAFQIGVEIMMTITRPARRGTATQLSTNIPYTRRPSGFLYRSPPFSLYRLQIYFVKDTSL